MDYTTIDPNDREAVLWLQTALSRLIRSARFRIGAFDPAVEKTLRLFQHKHGLPVTGKADEATLQKIRQELAKL